MAKIMGIDVDKIDEAAINAALELYGIKCTGKLNRKLRVLATHISKMREDQTEEEFDSQDCEPDEDDPNGCGGFSPGALTSCPYCGDGAPTPAETPTEPETAVSAATETAAPETPAEDVSAAPETPAAETPTKAPVIQKRSAAKKKATSKKAAAPKTTKETAPAGFKAGTTKKVMANNRRAAPEGEVVDEATGEVVRTGTSLVVDEAGTTVLAKFDLVDLDSSIAKCHGFMIDATLECFRLGTELNHISDNNLYLLRTGDDGKSLYTNFKVFVRNEFGMSHQQAYNLMGVAKNFTEEQVRKIGTTKLNLALKVPPEMREEILAAAESGATMSSLSEKANDILNKADGPKKPPPMGKALTAIIAMGLMEQPMFKTPTKPGKVGAKTKPASAVEDEPFAIFELENNVLATFQVLRNDKGKLVASLSFERGSEEA